jgi:hypothetical protein
MANFKIGRTMLAYDGTTPVTADEDNDADHPASNIAVYKRPFQTWRSDSGSPPTTPQDVRLDLATEGDVDALFINNTNFSTVAVATAPSGPGSFTPVSGSPFTIPRDGRVYRRKIWIDINLNNVQYIRLQPSVPDGSNPTYYEIGAAVAMDSVVTLADNPDMLPWTPQQAATVTNYAGGGFEANEDGKRYLEYQLGNSLWRRKNSTIMAELLSILDVGPAGCIVLYENLAEADKAYLFQWLTAPLFEEKFATFRAQFDFREPI